MVHVKGKGNQIMTGTGASGNCLEREVRLSQSVLWQLQRNFFETKGNDAWRQGIVPHYVTSNSYIAHAYAQVMKGFIKDYQCAPGFDPGQTVYIVELGAGSGRFSHYFLKHFFHDEIGKPVVYPLPVKYVMTDIARSNIEFWQNHSQFWPYLEQGLLDLAFFDLERDTALELLYSKTRISRNDTQGPVALIANYVLDSVSQDLFAIREHQLYECRVTLTTEEETTDLYNPELLNRLRVEYQPQAVTGEYYSHPGWNRLLSDYTGSLQDTALLFPVAGLQFFDNLKELTQGDILLLSADKGEIREAMLDNQPYPDLVRHGSFSLNVNYHALKQYALNNGGTVLHNSFGHASLNVAAFIFGQSGNDFDHTRTAYDRYISAMGPDDRYVLLKAITGSARCPTLAQVMALLRLTYYDTKVVDEWYEPLTELLPEAPLPQKEEVYQALQRLWEFAYLLSGEEPDLAFRIGVLLGLMGYYAEAIARLHQSQALSGALPYTAYNLAVNYLMLGDYAQARSAAEQCLALNLDLKTNCRALHQKIRWLERLADGKEYSPDADGLSNEAARPLQKLAQSAFIQNILKTAAVTLEILQPKHATVIYRQVTPEIMELTNLAGFESVEAVKYWILNESADPEKFTFATIHPELGLVGVIALTVAGADGYFYFWIGELFQCRGYGTTALCRLLEFAFDNLGVRHLFTGVFPHNERSRHIVERLGFELVESETGEMWYYGLGVERIANEMQQNKI